MPTPGTAFTPTQIQIASGAQGPFLYGPDGKTPIWFGPGQPLTPIPPAGTPSRTWDYPTFWNVYKTTDAGKALETGGITMSQLRMLAQQTHVRAAIETVKDKQSKKEWSFTLESLPGEKESETRRRARDDDRVEEVTEFFAHPAGPDSEMDFSDWLRMLLEDILVLDGGVIAQWSYEFVEVNPKPYALEVFDGATVQPLLDPSGRRPTGVDANGRPVAAYQQFIKGIPFENFSNDEMLYVRRNPRPGKAYGLSACEQLLLYINLALRKDITRMKAYTDGNIPFGLLPLPSEWDENKVTEWYMSFNNFVTGLPDNLVKMIPIPAVTSGNHPIFPGLEMMKSTDNWDEMWLRLVCFVFSIPPASLVQHLNKATAESASNQAEEEGEQVMSDFIRRVLNRIIRKWFGYTDIVARARAQRSVSPKDQAEIDKTYAMIGKVQPNELRERDGEEPYPELAGRNGIITATGFVDFPPPGTPVTDGDDNPDSTDTDLSEAHIVVPTESGSLLKFSPGSLVKTRRGLVRVESLGDGDELVFVKDGNGRRRNDGGYSSRLRKVTQTPTVPHVARLYVIRHGATDLNDGAKMRGWVDVPLNASGVEAAHSLGERLAGEPLDAILSSDLRRARQTAEIISGEIGRPVTEITSDLRPWNIGHFSGESEDAWPQIYDYAVNRPNEAIPNGEPFSSFKARYLNALQRLLLQYAGQSVAIVAHHRNERLTAAWLKAGGNDDQVIAIAEMGLAGIGPGEFVTYRGAPKSVS